MNINTAEISRIVSGGTEKEISDEQNIFLSLRRLGIDISLNEVRDILKDADIGVVSKRIASLLREKGVDIYDSTKINDNYESLN